jgi:hypothetical protein
MDIYEHLRFKDRICEFFSEFCGALLPRSQSVGAVLLHFFQRITR